MGTGECKDGRGSRREVSKCAAASNEIYIDRTALPVFCEYKTAGSVGHYKFKDGQSFRETNVFRAGSCERRSGKVESERMTDHLI